MTALSTILADVASALAGYSASVAYVPEVDRPGEDLVARRVLVVPRGAEASPVARNASTERVGVDVSVEQKTDEAGFPALCDDVRRIARGLSGLVLPCGWAVVRAETDPLYHSEFWRQTGVFLGAVRLELVAVEARGSDALPEPVQTTPATPAQTTPAAQDTPPATGGEG